MVAAVSGLSPVIITVRRPILPQPLEALANAGLQDVFEHDDAGDLLSFGDQQAASRPSTATSSTMLLRASAGRWPPLFLHVANDRVRRALADLPAVRAD